MKKLLFAAAILLFFLLVLAAILFKLLVPANSSPNTSPAIQNSQAQFPVSASVGSDTIRPDLFVTSFYTWYFKNATQDPEFPRLESRANVLKEWLTPQFIADWEQLQTVAEANPILLTAEDTSSWSTAVRAETSDQLSSTSNVRVTINTPSEVRVFSVHLIRDSNNLWKIDSITNAI